LLKHPDQIYSKKESSRINTENTVKIENRKRDVKLVEKKEQKKIYAIKEIDSNCIITLQGEWK
jgi:hypothetical protein